MPTKKLMRSKHKIVAGVLAGLAEYFGADPLVWRLGFVFVLVLTGLMPGVLLYAIAWFMMPDRATEPEYTVYE